MPPSNGIIRKNELQITCAEVMQWARLTKHRFNGRWTYGSERIFLDAVAKSELVAELSRRHQQRTGTVPDWTLDEACKFWSDCRKGNYIAMRDGVPILIHPEKEEQLQLFNDGVSDPACVVYAYSATIAAVPRRVIKIGFTTQKIGDYLNQKERFQRPELLSTMCGGRTEELEQLQKWRRHLVSGREWHRPVPAMLVEFKNKDAGWHPEPGIDRSFQEALKEWENE